MVGPLVQLRKAAAAGKAKKEVKIRRWKKLCSIDTYEEESLTQLTQGGSVMWMRMWTW